MSLAGGQIGYTRHILAGMINDIVHDIFRKVKSLSKAEILSTTHSAKVNEYKATAKRAQRDVEQSEIIMQELRVKYNQLIDWSNIYDAANIETQKMIIAQLIERVDVFRGYELKIKFAISV